MGIFTQKFQNLLHGLISFTYQWMFQIHQFIGTRCGKKMVFFSTPLFLVCKWSCTCQSPRIRPWSCSGRGGQGLRGPDGNSHEKSFPLSFFSFLRFIGNLGNHLLLELHFGCHRQGLVNSVCPCGCNALAGCPNRWWGYILGPSS